MKQWVYPIMVIVGASCYGTLSTIIKLSILDGFTASEAITSQFVIGFLLALIIFVLIRPKNTTFTGSTTLIFAGIFTAVTGVLYGKSVSFMPASLAVVMLFQFTWIGMLIDCSLKKRLPTRVELISLFFLFGGTIFAAGVIGIDLSGIPWQGWFYGMLAAISFASFLLINQVQTPGITTETRLLLTSFYAVIVVLILQSPEILWNGTLLNEGLWKYGLILGALGIVIPIFLFSVGIPKVGGAAASILGAAELPVAVIISMILLHETVTPLQFLGIAIILFGIALPNIINRKGVHVL